MSTDQQTPQKIITTLAAVQHAEGMRAFLILFFTALHTAGADAAFVISSEQRALNNDRRLVSSCSTRSGCGSFATVRHYVITQTIRCASNSSNEEDSSSQLDDGRRLCMSSIVGTLVTAMTFAHQQSALALSPQEASSDYDSYAETYDQLDGGTVASAFGLSDARSQLLQKAKGRVLEIGAGTGLNLEFYNQQKVTSLTCVDISQGMLTQAKQRADDLQIKVDFKVADATRDLVDMFGTNSFDTVIDTFSLCVMGNQGAKQALEQASQVVKSARDGGLVLLLENSRASNPLLGWYQDVTAETAASSGGKGCLYNQNVQALIEQTRPLLTIENQQAYAGGLFRSFECVKQ